MTSLGTHFSYDEVPYPDLCYVQTHPDRLSTLAKLLGMSPISPEQCRVLEIGCAGGGNLIPMAVALPGSTFVGIDYSAVQVEHARSIAAQVGLSNITFHHLDMKDITSEFGQFDYIIAHGIYSWVSPELQDKLLAVCKQNLALQGVAYVSYNTYPGWHMLEVVRNMMLFRTRNIEDPSEKSSTAREWMAFITDALKDSSETNYASFLNSYMEFRPTRTMDFDHMALLHDELEEFNSPVYFHQFAAHAERHGLQYLAEADFPTVMPNGLRPDVVQQLQHTARTTVEMEQYLDFLRNRMFRRTLLCHSEVEVNRRLSTDPIRDFYVTSLTTPVVPAPDEQTSGIERFRASDGAVFSTDHPVTRSAFHYLAEVSPHAVLFLTLLEKACARLNIMPNERDAGALAANLLRAFTYSLNLVEFHTCAPKIVTELTDKPIASSLARYQAAHGDSAVSLWHRRADLDGTSRVLLPLLDGNHDRAALFEHLMRLVEEGKMGVQDGDQPVASSERAREILAHELNDTLRWLAKSALLIG